MLSFGANHLPTADGLTRAATVATTVHTPHDRLDLIAPAAGSAVFIKPLLRLA